MEIADLADSSVHTLPMPGAQQRNPVTFLPELLGFTAQGHAILAPDGSMVGNWQPAGFNRALVRNYPAMHLAEYNLQGPISLLRTFAIHVPRDVEIGSITLSPQGDRLLWAVRCNITPPFVAI